MVAARPTRLAARRSAPAGLAAFWLGSGYGGCAVGGIRPTTVTAVVDGTSDTRFASRYSAAQTRHLARVWPGNRRDRVFDLLGRSRLGVFLWIRHWSDGVHGCTRARRLAVGQRRWQFARDGGCVMALRYRQSRSPPHGEHRADRGLRAWHHGVAGVGRRAQRSVDRLASQFAGRFTELLLH